MPRSCARTELERGIKRGRDIFKALALGRNDICDILLRARPAHTMAKQPVCLIFVCMLRVQRPSARNL